MNSQGKFVWIDADVVYAVHEAQIAEHGGPLGIRDAGLLASALERPINAAAYAESDMAELAALYALGIIKNHPFVDGNKRVGAVLLELFLNINNYALTASDKDVLGAILRVAAGEISEKEFITWVGGNSAAQEFSLGD